MLVDARDSDVSLDRSVRLAIVGGGAAGIALAQALRGAGDVLVIEAGGREPGDVGEHAGIVACVGLPYPVEETRRSGFGGSTDVWAGYCALFDEADFAARAPGEPGGWPIGHGELDAYYERSAALLNVPDFDFDAAAFAERSGERCSFSPDFHMDVWRFGRPTARFSEEFGASFDSAGDIATLTNARVVDIRLADDGQTVTEVILRTSNGRTGRVRADIVVLACGGIETARLLLNADSQCPGGIGNAGDMVGRCFMEHPHLPIPGVRAADDLRLAHWTGRGCTEAGGEFEFLLGIAPHVRRREGLLNARAHAFHTPRMDAAESACFGLFLEQVPNPSSRVRLIADRDGMGLRRAALDWRIAPEDWRSYRRTATMIRDELVRTGLARAEPGPAIEDIGESDLLHSNHHLGTTRMSADARGGVVDPQCRVHGTTNLYVAGGSVFSTGSWANPTMTVLALALRLADHLRPMMERAAGKRRID